MPVFRPTCRVRMQLRLDEGAKKITPTATSNPLTSASGGQTDIAGALEKNAMDRQLLGKLKKNLSPPQFTKQLQALDQERAALQSQTTGSKQAYPGGVDPNKGEIDQGTIPLGFIPSSAAITRSPTKDADTAQIVFPFRDLPIDPRSVRSALVTITLGVTSVDDYAQGMGEFIKRANGEPLSLIEYEEAQELRPFSTSRFAGFAATWKVTCDDGGDYVSIDCVDVSAVLRGQKLHGKKIDLTKPIEKGVQELIDAFPTSRGLKVVLGTPVDSTSPDDVQAPTGGSFTPADAMPPTLKRRRGRAAPAAEKSDKETVWDHINDVVLRLGLIPVVRGFVLYLLEPRVLAQNLLNSRKMVYGRNVKKLEMTRKMEGITTDTIEIRCPDRSIGRVRWARYPVLKNEPKSGILGKAGSPQPTTSRSSKVTPNGTGQEQVRVLTVRGISELATLERIAECTWHEMSRQEIQGTFETNDVQSWDSEIEADLLDLQSGDVVQILVEVPDQNKEDLANTSYQEIAAMSIAQRKAHLISWGISPDSAQKLAESQEMAASATTFRTNYVNIRWDAEEGVSIEGDFSNFIVIREDPDSEDKATGKRIKTRGEAFNK